MDRFPKSSTARVTLFRNGFFESFTVFPLAGFLILWPLVLIAVAYVAFSSMPTPWVPLWVVMGWVVWSATEYALHRFVFHLDPKSSWLKQVIFVIHGNHHASPNDPLRNLMPPIISLPLGGAIWGLMVFAFGPVGHWLFFGFILGYVIYDLVHFACHQFAMKGAFWRVLKQHHMRHHFDRVEGNYAITGMIWDRLTGTRISGTKAQD